MMSTGEHVVLYCTQPHHLFFAGESDLIKRDRYIQEHGPLKGLVKACIDGHHGVVKAFIEMNPDINGKISGIISIFYGNIQII